MKEWFSPCNKHLVQWKTLISHSNVALNPFKCCFKCNLVESIYSSWVLRIPKHTDMLQKDWVLIEIFEINQKRYHSRNWYKYLWFLKLKLQQFLCVWGVLESSGQAGSNPYLSLVLNLDQYLIEISKFSTAPGVSLWDCSVHCQV